MHPGILPAPVCAYYQLLASPKSQKPFSYENDPLPFLVPLTLLTLLNLPFDLASQRPFLCLSLWPHSGPFSHSPRYPHLTVYFTEDKSKQSKQRNRQQQCQQEVVRHQ